MRFSSNLKIGEKKNWRWSYVRNASINREAVRPFVARVRRESDHSMCLFGQQEGDAGKDTYGVAEASVESKGVELDIWIMTIAASKEELFQSWKLHKHSEVFQKSCHEYSSFWCLLSHLREDNSSSTSDMSWYVWSCRRHTNDVRLFERTFINSINGTFEPTL